MCPLLAWVVGAGLGAGGPRRRTRPMLTGFLRDEQSERGVGRVVWLKLDGWVLGGVPCLDGDLSTSTDAEE